MPTILTGIGNRDVQKMARKHLLLLLANIMKLVGVRIKLKRLANVAGWLVVGSVIAISAIS